ncbi:MAG: hypothetical protein IJ715_03650 [Bacilli bacterium]|nr:hypothetical protein [Bacilli bacterium]
MRIFIKHHIYDLQQIKDTYNNFDSTETNTQQEYVDTYSNGGNLLFAGGENDGKGDNPPQISAYTPKDYSYLLSRNYQLQQEAEQIQKQQDNTRVVSKPKATLTKQQKEYLSYQKNATDNGMQPMKYEDYVSATNRTEPTIGQSNKSDEYLQNLFESDDRNLVEKVSDFVFPKTTYVMNPNTGYFSRQNRVFKQNIDNAIETTRPITDWTVGLMPITATPYWTMIGGRDIMKGDYLQGALEFAPGAYKIAEKIPSIIDSTMRRGMLSASRFSLSPNPVEVFIKDLKSKTDRKNSLSYFKDALLYTLTGNPNYFPKIYTNEEGFIRGANTGNLLHDGIEAIENSKSNKEHYNYFRSLPDNIIGANTMGKEWLNPQKLTPVESGSDLDMLLKATFGENYRTRFNGSKGTTYAYSVNNVSDIISQGIKSENILEKTANGNNMIISAGNFRNDITKGFSEAMEPEITYDNKVSSKINVAGNQKIIGQVELNELDDKAKEVYNKLGMPLPERNFVTYRTADAYKFEPEAYKKRWLMPSFKDKIAIPFLKKYHKYENPIITIEENPIRLPLEDRNVYDATEYHFNNKKYGGYLLWI